MPDMTIAMAREILKVGAAHNAWEEAGQTPETVSEEQAFRDAAELVGLARTSYDKDVRDAPAVIEILFAAQVEPTKLDDGTVKYADIYEKKGVPVPDASSNGGESAPAETPAAGDVVDISAIFPGYDDKKAKDIVQAIKDSAASGDLTPEELEQIQSYEAATEQRKAILELSPTFKPKPAPAAQEPTAAAAPGDYGSTDDLKRAYESGELGLDRISQERMPLPQQYQGEEPVLPVDITAMSNENLSRLVMRFHSLEARALWLLSQEEGRQEAAASLRQDAHRSAFTHHFERLKSALDKQTPTAVGEARSDANKEADNDQTVVTWRNRETRHSIEVRSLKALANGWEKAIARLSREQSRRENLASKPAS